MQFLRKRARLVSLLPWVILAAGCGSDASTGFFNATYPNVLGTPSPTASPTPIVMGPATNLTDPMNTAKGRLIEVNYDTGGGVFQSTLVVVYDGSNGQPVRDLFGRTFNAQDVFMRRSTDGGVTWSTPLNLSNMSNLSSINLDTDGDPETPDAPFYGNCDKPNIISNGSNILVTWTSAYVPGGAQGTVRYPASGNIQIPFYGVYAARSLDGGATWSQPQLLTDGTRDATNDTNRGTGNAWGITWQEDPLGLQPGEAEGPGDGGSGSKVSPGTDIWYTSLSNTNFGAGNAFPAPVRASDNRTGTDENGVDTGTVGASRPNLFFVGGTSMLAYDETKGTGDTGRYVRYHVFPATAIASDPTAGQGTIISDPSMNARRVRLVAQSTAGTVTGLRLFIFWREGLSNQGGPADIVGRVGIQTASNNASTGFRPEDMLPAVAAGATNPAQAAGNVRAVNLSSDQGLTAGTEANPLENALAHRAIVRGDALAVGYSWSPDGNLANSTTQANYNFFVRTTANAGTVWDKARNISQITDTSINVKEPRLVGTPNSTDPGDPSNPRTFVVAWSTEQKNPPAPNTDLDVFFTRSTDFGASYEQTQTLAGGPNPQFETQLRLSASGNTLSAIWMETINNITAVLFAQGTSN